MNCIWSAPCHRFNFKWKANHTDPTTSFGFLKRALRKCASKYDEVILISELTRHMLHIRVELSWVEMVFHLSHVIEPLYIQRARRCASIRELVFPEQKNVSHSNLCLFHFPSLFTFSCYSTHFPSTKKHFVNHLDFGKNHSHWIIFHLLYHICTVNLPPCKMMLPHCVCVTCVTIIVVNAFVFIVRIDI